MFLSAKSNHSLHCIKFSHGSTLSCLNLSWRTSVQVPYSPLGSGRRTHAVGISFKLQKELEMERRTPIAASERRTATEHLHFLPRPSSNLMPMLVPWKQSVVESPRCTSVTNRSSFIAYCVAVRTPLHPGGSRCTSDKKIRRCQISRCWDHRKSTKLHAQKG